MGKKPQPSKKAKNSRLLGPQLEIALLIAIMALTLGVRLVRLNSPLVDFHAHRQTQTASTSRSFYNQTLNIFEPRYLQIDANKKAPGVTEMEFPLYQYIIGLIYRVVGVHEQIGRLISIAFALGVSAYLYVLTKRYFGATAALGATLFYAINPVAVFFNRNFQPDTAALFFFIGGIYHLSVWFDERRERDAIMCVGFTSLSLLIKPPVLLVIAPWVVYEFWRRRLWEANQRRHLAWLVGSMAVIIGLVGGWYVYTYYFIFKVTGLTVMRGRIGPPMRTTEYWFSPSLYVEALKRIWLLLTPVGAGLLAVALVPVHRSPKGRMLTLLFAGYLLYFIIVAEYNLPHFYYQLPFLPIAAMYVGWLTDWTVGWARANKIGRVAGPALLCIALATTAFLSYQTIDPWYNVNHAPLIIEAAKKTLEIAGPEARTIANTPFFADFYYYSNSNMPYVKYFKNPGAFAYYDTKYNPMNGKFEPIPPKQALKDFGVEYVIWLKYQPFSLVDEIKDDADLVADTRLYSIWKIR